MKVWPFSVEYTKRIIARRPTLLLSELHSGVLLLNGGTTCVHRPPQPPLRTVRVQKQRSRKASRDFLHVSRQILPDGPSLAVDDPFVLKFANRCLHPLHRCRVVRGSSVGVWFVLETSTVAITSILLPIRQVWCVLAIPLNVLEAIQNVDVEPASPSQG